jgi:hypothetical protein
MMLNSGENMSNQMAPQMDEESLPQIVLDEFPYPVAVNYRRMLDETNWQVKTIQAVKVFDYTLRMVTIGLTSQYICCDAEAVSDPAVNGILLNNVRGKKLTLGGWKSLLFRLLDAYHGKRERFFMPELYDAFWDTSTRPHKKRSVARQAFERLVQIRNEVIHGAPPSDEKGWCGLNRAVLELLHDVLERFVFLKDYDLIHITGKQGEGEYAYELYTGQEVKAASKTLSYEGKVEGEWAYVSQDRERLLRLHPWLRFWQEPVKDAALFDHFSANLLRYLATVAGVNMAIMRTPDVVVPDLGVMNVNIVDESAIKKFVELVWNTIEEVKVEREAAERLTWPVLKRKAFEISRQRIGDVQNKYRPQLHYRRKLIEDTFEDFLASDKTCLVLVGGSGVGKSHFILGQRRKLKDDPHISTLIYSGTYLDAEKPLSQLITDDFNRILRLTEGTRREIDDIFLEINAIPNIAVRDVVLFFDGINESPDAKRLLRQIDKLVQDLGILEWLKVVVTSRPETWRTIKRGLNLATHRYYRLEGQEEIPIEFKRFSREESARAYKKYQRIYDLQTAWEDIPMEMRETLQHPLYMWLISEANEGKSLSLKTERSQIFADYIQALRDTERLESGDLAFLRHDLTPLMIDETRCDNSISGDMLAFSQSHDGRPMSELIQNDEKLSTGQRVNQSFINLCNAGILTKQELVGSYEIGFQYEGFYEYFGGERLFQVHKGKSEEQKITVYRNLFGQINEKPYLWGVLKRSLKLELSELKSQYLVEQLCYAEEPMIQDLLVATLREFGDEYTPDTVAPILMSLLEEQVEETNLKSRTSKRIAIRVARHLKALNPLVTAAVSTAEPVRAMAAQEAYYLWQDDHDAGIELLEKVAQEIKGKLGIPRRSVIEFCLTPSLLIVFGHSEEQESLKPLREVWRNILQNLGLSPKRGHLLSTLVRGGVLRMVVGLLLRWARVTQEMKFQLPFTAPEIAAFFDLPSEQKEQFRGLIPYLDPEETDISDAMPILRRVATHRDVLSAWLIELVILAHSKTSPEDALQALEMAFDVGISMKPAGPTMQYTFFAFTALNRGSVLGAFSPELADKYLDMAQAIYTRTKGEYVTATGNQYAFVPVLRSAFIYDSATGEFPDRIKDFLNDLLTTPIDPELVEHIVYVAEEFGVQFEQFEIQPETYSQLFDLILRRSEESLTPSENETVRSLVVDALAHMRLYRPDDVEDFIATYDVSEKEIIQIRNKAVETVGEIFMQCSSAFGIEAVATDRFRELRNQLMWILKQTTTRKSSSRWFTLFLKGVLNIIYGETIFDIGIPF